jgi:drug/metabolite transporter (DMT)-like permease
MTAAQNAENLRGISLMTGSMALFAFEDMFLKFSAQSLPTGEILLLTCIPGFLFFAGLARTSGRRVLNREAFHPWVVARNLGEVIGTYGYITALAAVPLATVSAVLQAMPLAVTLAAALFLGETVGWRRWSAIGVGFAGVLLVIRPGMEGFQPAGLWVLVTVAGLALRDLASRLIPAEYATSQVSAWGVASVAVLGAGMTLVQGAEAPSAWQGLMLAGAFVFGTAGYWAITAATRKGDVSVVSPFRYSRLVFAIVVGWLAFAEYPDRMTLIGAALIIASGLYSFMRERIRARASARAEAARDPGLSTPAKPALSTPAKPALSTPAQPALSTPAQPALSTPAQPALSTPAKPALSSVTKQG